MRHLAASLGKQLASGVETGGGAGNRLDEVTSVHDVLHSPPEGGHYARVRTRAVSGFSRTYDVIRSIFVSVPLRMASFSLLFRNEALSTRSTVTGQLNGLSVP